MIPHQAPVDWPVDAPPPADHDLDDYLRLLVAERVLSEGRPLPLLLAALHVEEEQR